VYATECWNGALFKLLQLTFVIIVWCAVVAVRDVAVRAKGDTNYAGLARVVAPLLAWVERGALPKYPQLRLLRIAKPTQVESRELVVPRWRGGPDHV
jgi:hypothetical protein